MKLLGDIWDYGWLVFRRVDFACGGVLAIIYFFAAEHIGLGNYKGYVTVGIVVVAVIEASYAVYRKERVMRSEREQHTRVTARISSIAANVPDPGPTMSSLRVDVYWEMWTDRVVTLDQMALNFIYGYDRPWWNFWAKRLVPQKGLPRQGADSTEFRLTIQENMSPYHDIATFEYSAPRNTAYNPHWLLEFVIKTGMPLGEYRIPIFLDHDELRRRGTHPPL